MLSAGMLQRSLGIPPKRAALWLPHMQSALELAQITTPQRLACFLAQVGHESGRLIYTRELWGPTKAQARYEPSTTLSKRLGNVRPGDGARFMGRGLIQVTGRANYLHATRRMRAMAGESAPDFMADPKAMERPAWAAMTAALFWRDHGLNKWADAFDFVTLTRRINGGTNGLADRQHLYTQALCAIYQD